MHKPNDLIIRTTTGTEGPKDDPYGFTVWDVRLPNKSRIVYRDSTLGNSMATVYNAEGHEIAEVTGPDGKVQRYFERMVGHKLDQIMEWANHFEDPIRF